MCAKIETTAYLVMHAFSGRRNGTTESATSLSASSASSALALRCYTNREAEADFFATVDVRMDVLNAGHPSDVKPLCRGYSGRPEEEAALTALVEEVAAFRVGGGGGRFLYPFQKGLLVTVRAVRGLLADLQGSEAARTF